MLIKNPLLGKIKVSSVESFTSKKGLKIRRLINPPFRKILKIATKRKIFLESYPKLEKGTPYIFASTHSFDEDIIAGLATIDRNAYVLIGTTDQIDYNPQMYAAWINGMVYVDRLDERSRKDSVEKMIKVLENGTSILIFPEGGWNNTENLLVQPLFAGPYILAKKTNIKVVPVATFNEHNSNEIHISFGEPLDIASLEKKEALSLLRDSMASLMFNMIEKYSTPIVREELSGDIHINFMRERVLEYLRVNWSHDVWDEELSVYRDKSIVMASDVRSSLSKVKVTKDNAHLLAPIFAESEKDEKYDFKKYIKRNWRNIK